MKKILLLSCLLIPIAALSQKYTLRPFYSYNTSLLPNTWSANNDHTVVTVDTSITYYSSASKDVSLGKGSRFGISIEKNCEKPLSFGATLSFFKSADQPLVSISEAEYSQYTIYNVSLKTTDTYSARAIGATLYAHYQIADKPVAPYINAGVIFGYSKYTMTREIFIRNNMPGYYPTELYNYKYKISPSFQYGVTGAFGAEFYRQHTISFFAEAEAVLMSTSFKKRTCTSKTWESEDQTDQMTMSEKEILYVDEILETDNQRETQPTKVVKFKQSLSSIGFRCGFQIHF